MSCRELLADEHGTFTIVLLRLSLSTGDPKDSVNNISCSLRVLSRLVARSSFLVDTFSERLESEELLLVMVLLLPLKSSAKDSCIGERKWLFESAL